MNHKERVKATLRRGTTDRTPVDCWLYQRQFLDKLEAEWGTREQFLDEFGIDFFLGYIPYPNQTGRMWDVKELPDYDPGDPHDPKWITHTDWNYDFAGLNVVEAVRQQGSKRYILAHVWGMVEGTSRIIGIENCWMNLGAQPKIMAGWFDRYADWLCGLVESIKEAGADGITLSDDWGSNNTMLFNPRTWRNLIAPYSRRVVAHAHEIGLFVNLHSDGYIMQIMDEIVEIGYDSLHPVQESSGMDPQTIKDRYGDKITIYGSLDVIDGLLAYEGDELDEYISKRFAIYAPGGGFIFNTGHFVQPDIPPMRLVRAYGTVKRLAAQYHTP